MARGSAWCTWWNYWTRPTGEFAGNGFRSRTGVAGNRAPSRRRQDDPGPRRNCRRIFDSGRKRGFHVTHLHLSRFSDRSFDLVPNLDGAISFSGAIAARAILKTCGVARSKVVVTFSIARKNGCRVGAGIVPRHLRWANVLRKASRAATENEGSVAL